MDRGGTSDPYVVIKQENETLHKCVEKKKTVNPVWNDQSNVCVENVFSPLVYEVSELYSLSTLYRKIFRCMTEMLLVVMTLWVELSLI